MLPMNFFASAEELSEYLVTCRRRLHQIPETHFELPRTMDFIASQLDEMNIPYRVVTNGGIIGLLGSPGNGHTFLLRADMDALPMEENSGEPFASQNGNMHACGHDFHMAMLLGAARLLKTREAQLPGAVKLVFQSNEEGIAGMKVLLENDLLASPQVDAAMAVHVLPGEFEVGTYTCLEGPASSSVTEYKIEIFGKGTHGATPHKGVDPINIGVHIYTALMAMLTKETDARETALVSNGYFRGGTPEAYNVIPAKAVMGGGIRTFNNEVAEYIKARLVEIAEKTADAFHAECRVSFPASAPASVNDGSVTQCVNQCAAACGLSNLRRRPQVVSDDFSYVSVRVPSCYVWLGAGADDKNHTGGVLHDPRVRFNEKALPLGAALMADTAMSWLNNNP